MLENELQLERNLFFQLNGSDSIFWDNFMWLYSYKFTWIPLYICFFIVFIYKKNWKEYLMVFLAITLLILLCDQIASGLFKPLFERFRPTHHPDFKDQVDTVLGYRGGKYGFASSHASNMFGFAMFTALLFRNKLFSCVIFFHALLTAYSRVYLGVHFISDVVAGAMVGIIVGLFIYYLYSTCEKRFLKLDKTNSHMTYPIKQIWFLCGAYISTAIALLLFNNQLIKPFL